MSPSETGFILNLTILQCGVHMHHLFRLQKYLPLTLYIKATKIKTDLRKFCVILVAYLGGHIQRILMVVCAEGPPSVRISNIL